MNPDEYEKLVTESLDRRLELSRKKRHDYADTTDVLANFKRLGEAVRVLRINQLWNDQPALAYGLFMVIMKIDRLVNLKIGGKVPINESDTDTWDDALNYLDLAHAIYVETNQMSKSIRRPTKGE